MGKVRTLTTVALSLMASAGAGQTPLPPVGCLIQPLDVVDLASPVAGLVSEVLVERGDHVTTGQRIAQFDTALEVVELDAARARASNTHAIAAAESRLAFREDMAIRMARLADRNAISDTDADEARMEADTARQALEEARVALRVAQIDVQAAAARLDRKILRSPIDGLVTSRSVSPGEFRDGDDPVVTIARIDRLRVEAYVPLEYYPALSIGDVVQIIPEAPIGGRHTAYITVIDQVFDAASATLGIVMELPNPDLTMPAGLRCEVSFGDG